jgi:hypothetical protein
MSYSIDYLKENSRLPGPRANLELLYQFIENATDTEIDNCMSIADSITLNSPSEFVLFCGVAALIKKTAILHGTVDIDLTKYSNHESWRIRESVCFGFQWAKPYLTPDEMMENLSKLKNGTALDKRAYFATLCDPILLNDYVRPSDVLADLLEITVECFNMSEKLDSDMTVLRKALGYCWSVAICADETLGKQTFDKLLNYSDSKHILWIVKENLKKNRLIKLDTDWVERLKTSINKH